MRSMLNRMSTGRRDATLYFAFLAGALCTSGVLLFILQASDRSSVL